MRKFWDNIKDYLIIIAVVLLIRTFLVTPAIVSGDSMDDTLEDGQLIIINKIVYRIKDIKRFDIIVLSNKVGKDKLIKRVIGLPNETIKYENNVLYINDEIVETNLVFEDTEDFVMTTKDNEYLVLGDNRDNSLDSRYLGNFNRKDIIGRVDIRLLPIGKFGKIDK